MLTTKETKPNKGTLERKPAPHPVTQRMCTLQLVVCKIPKGMDWGIRNWNPADWATSGKHNIDLREL